MVLKNIGHLNANYADSDWECKHFFRLVKIQIVTSVKTTAFLKQGIVKIIVHVIIHADFQRLRRILTELFGKKKIRRQICKQTNSSNHV